MKLASGADAAEVCNLHSWGGYSDDLDWIRVAYLEHQSLSREGGRPGQGFKREG